MPKLKTKSLSPKQLRFVSEYLVDLNATQAMIRAGYSKHSANADGPRMLVHAGIQAEIARRTQKLAERAELKAETVLRRLNNILTTNMQDFYDSDGRMIPINELPRDKADALASVKTLKTNIRSGDGVQEETLELKQWDVNRSAELAARIFGLVHDKPEPSTGSTIHVTVNFINANGNQTGGKAGGNGHGNGR